MAKWWLCHSSQGKTLKAAGWDFSIGASSSTGTVRSVVKPPQARERKADVSLSQAPPRRTAESGSRWSSSGSTNNISEVSVQRDARDPLMDEKQEHYHEDVCLLPLPRVTMHMLQLLISGFCLLSPVKLSN